MNRPAYSLKGEMKTASSCFIQETVNFEDLAFTIFTNSVGYLTMFMRVPG